ncbi:MAG: peptidyl-prolyl cis-trans isomerase [Moorea sp. SIOASIH]|uniref:peptidylprolyl isomerase n=1 Tax=Moorena sp. SIOASIH TaxID=2607817 RepID=UPI0013BA323D|nr:peptidylprolyl isomerase [Moorena sp. SIOASIH]NEO42404.1 peptidyl-prolyl cis-trans isomerase [Moorena sp. SIOASIH]
MQDTATTLINQETSLSEIPVKGQDDRPKPLIRILREPLLHFLVLGALLFGLYFWVAGPSITSDSPKHIDISAGTIEFLKTTWQRQWGREPLPQELESLVDNYVRDEVLYQEALALGLDQNDTIVRRRVIQKMQFLTEDVSPVREPSDEELQAYLGEHAERYTIPGKFSFAQIYFSRDMRRDRTDAEAQDFLNQLQANPNLERFQQLGDRSMLPITYTLASAETLTNTFGGTFAQEMAGVTETGWQGPLHSAYGSHLVYVSDIQPGHVATLAEVRRDARRDWMRDQRQQLDEQFYEQLRDRYTVSIDQDALKQAIQEDQG